MSSRRPSFVPRTEWTSEQLEADRLHAIERFRRERLEEPIEQYLEHFDQVQGVLEDLVERTEDLT